jgi:nucleotide-binding universal stress UspA family protein
VRILKLKTVLVATDLNEASVPAIEAAHLLAKAAGARLHAAHVGVANQRSLDSVHTLLRRAGVPPTDATTHALSGDPPRAIEALAREISADVIVIGPHGADEFEEGKPKLGTALSVAAHSDSPCLVVAKRARFPVHRVVVAVDTSETSRSALAVGLSWASALREQPTTSPASVTLTALHVDERSAETSGAGESPFAAALATELGRIRDAAGTWAGVGIERAVVRSTDVPAAIAQFGTEHAADLIVLGTRGMGSAAMGRVGAVATQVAQHATLPTLLVPAGAVHD